MTLMTACQQCPAEAGAEAEVEEEAEGRAPHQEEDLREAEVSTHLCLSTLQTCKARREIPNHVLGSELNYKVLFLKQLFTYFL